MNLNLSVEFQEWMIYEDREVELAIQENSSARSTKGVAQTAPRVIHPGLSPGVSALGWPSKFTQTRVKLETQKKHFYYYFIHWPL